ncbi:FMN-dependent dehydrogenase-like protein 2 [Elsinoe australis]|uniref:FMN-dependent dehydrogenase-like protein 2 n=1 Tax=Elsinoe australis TaxID=40998 RepID=A0A4V6DU71_9PEZI|nr:FMN-dependent dehydrogenase-like protein 2 [Elsinoe australis]
MRFSTLPLLATTALAAREFLNEADTGIELVYGNLTSGQLPPLQGMQALPDFEWAARNFLSDTNYTYYRSASSGEYSYRNNLEVFQRLRFRPKVLNDVTGVGNTLNTTILGHRFSAPFFIAPAARAGYAHPDAEANLVRGANTGNILYMPALYASLPIEQIAAAKPANGSQVLMWQLYAAANFSVLENNIRRAERAGAQALVLTVDAPGAPIRHRAARFGQGSANTELVSLTWDLYNRLKNTTRLPIIPKGIQNAEDAQIAVRNGAPAIYISNHGGRSLDGSPSSLEIALDIYENPPEVFTQTEVLADGGVRYGNDVLKLLALGVRAVGLGRPFMYSNVYGQPGVEKLISILKAEIVSDAANLGVADLKKIDTSFLNLRSLSQGFWAHSSP